MKRILVWDVPVRLFHWLLAAAFLGAFVIANAVDDEGRLFVVHMWLGGTAAFMVILRLLWGLFGTRYARFGAFDLRPSALFAYLKAALTGKADRPAGHNPATAWAAVAMFVIVLGLALTGAFMSSGGEAFEEVHEVLAWAMIAIVGVHVAGIVWHTIRFRENIAQTMVDGKKEADPSAAIPKTHALAGVAFLALTGLWAGGLYGGYDAATHSVTLPLVGTTLQLGEGEEDEHGEHDDDEYDEHRYRGTRAYGEHDDDDEWEEYDDD